MPLKASGGIVPKFESPALKKQSRNFGRAAHIRSSLTVRMQERGKTARQVGCTSAEVLTRFFPSSNA